MTSVSKEDQRRNRPGMQSYQNRLINRANAVVYGGEFPDRIRQARRQWNDDHPSLRIRVFDSLADLEQSDAIEVMHGLDEWIRVPKGTLQHISEDETGWIPADFLWEQMIKGICDEFWPERHFPRMGRPQNPAHRFVESCLYCDILNVIPHLDRLFPVFEVRLHALPYEPTSLDPWYQAVLTGQRDFWKRMAREAFGQLSGESLPDDFMELSASNEGNQYARDHGVGLVDLNAKPREELFWFLPVTPFMSTDDAKSIVPQIVEISRMLSGPNFIDDLILELKAEGQTHEEVASRLGVSIDTVKRAVRKGKGE